MIKVLIVEDEPVAAEALATYVARVPLFAVAGRAGSGAEALRQLATVEVDLLLLDIRLPGMSGLELLRQIRAAGNTTDVITVTRSGDLAVMRAAVSYGVVGYLIKPFTFSGLRSKLESYLAYHAGTHGRRMMADQHEVDEVLATLRATGPDSLPPGISRESLDAVIGALLRGGPSATSLSGPAGSGPAGPGPAGSVFAGVSASEMGEVLGASRVTARRYLEYLAAQGTVARAVRYRGAGRPEVEYVMRKVARPSTT